MSIWTERIDASQILVRLRELGPAIDEALARDDNEDTDVDTLARLRTVLTFIGKRLDAADGHLLLASNLESLAGAIGNVTSHVKGFAKDGGTEQLTHANNAMDSAIATFSAFMLPTTPDDLAGLREAATSYRNTMERELSLWGNGASDARGRVEELKKEVDALRQQLAAEIEHLNSAVTDVKKHADTVRTQLEQAHEASTKRLADDNTAKLGEWQNLFDTAEKARGDAEKAAAGERQAEFSAVIEKYESALDESSAAWDKHRAETTTADRAAQTQLQTLYEDKAAAIVKTIEGHLDRVKELVGAIGDHGVTAGFKREADDARGEVVFWHRVTFWSMVLLILVGLGTAFHVFESALTWISLASRLYLSIAIGVLAAYGASQASRYQQRERKSRKLELELRALGPFLEPVDPARREEFRLKIAEVFFGKDDGLTDKPGPATPLQLSTASIEKVIEIADKALDKLPGQR
jgi:hypothetical protein